MSARQITGEQVYEILRAAELANRGAYMLDPYEVLADWFNSILRAECDE